MIGTASDRHAHYERGEQKVQDRLVQEAHIVAVADAFDAMTSTRSYRRALLQEVAFAELRDKSGTQFNPECVDALVSAIVRRGEHYGLGCEQGPDEFDVPPPVVGVGSAGLGDLVPRSTPRETASGVLAIRRPPSWLLRCFALRVWCWLSLLGCTVSTACASPASPSLLPLACCFRCRLRGRRPLGKPLSSLWPDCFRSIGISRSPAWGSSPLPTLLVHHPRIEAGRRILRWTVASFAGGGGAALALLAVPGRSPMRTLLHVGVAGAAFLAANLVARNWRRGHGVQPVRLRTGGSGVYLASLRRRSHRCCPIDGVGQG